MTSGTILVADDDAAIRTVLNQALSRSGYTVRLTSNAATLWRWVAEGEGDVVITDVVMPDGNAFDLIPRIKRTRPDLPIVVMSAQNTFMTAIRASEKGAYEYLPKPFDLKELTADRRPRARRATRRASAPRRRSEAGDAIPLVGRSPAMQDIYRMLARLMQTDLTVMISGESGTGKELVARALHDYGKRRKGPVRRGQHGGDPARADRVGALRPRARRLHRRAGALGRALRAGGRRHALPRRDRRHADGGADAAAPRAAAGRIHDRRRAHADPHRRPHHRRHQQGSAPAHPPGTVPRGSLLPPERGSDPAAAAPRAHRRHPRPRAAFPCDGRARGAAGEEHRAERARGDAALPLARQRARARKSDPASHRALSAGDHHRADRGERDRPDVGDRSRRRRRRSTMSAARSSATSRAISASSAAACRRPASTSASCGRWRCR